MNCPTKGPKHNIEFEWALDTKESPRIKLITTALLKFEEEHGHCLDGISKDPFPLAPHGVFAVMGREVVGGLTFNLRNDWLFLDCGFVFPEWRRKGIYRCLMDLVEHFALTCGCYGIQVSTYAFEAPAVYERLGYVQGTVRRNFPRGNTSIDYIKELKAV